MPNVQQATPRRTQPGSVLEPLGNVCDLGERKSNGEFGQRAMDVYVSPAQVPWPSPSLKKLRVTPFISEHIPCRGHSFEYNVPKKSVIVSFSRCRTLLK